MNKLFTERKNLLYAMRLKKEEEEGKTIKMNKKNVCTGKQEKNAILVQLYQNKSIFTLL